MPATWAEDRIDPRREGARAPGRSPDSDLLLCVGRDLASVYRDVLCLPLPPRIASLIVRLGGGEPTASAAGRVEG